jgi:TMEM175 potassium channel family protein
MGKNRLEAFSDGVIAILITIMVLEMKVPHGEGIETLVPVIPVFLSYVLSFVYLGIYWNNHHHMLYATHTVTGLMLWANLHRMRSQGVEKACDFSRARRDSADVHGRSW